MLVPHGPSPASAVCARSGARVISAPPRSSWSKTQPARATSPNHRARNRATRSSCQSIDGWRALRPAASWEFKLMGAAACGAASPARLASTPDHHTVGCVDGSLLAITSSTRLPAHDNNPLQASSAENPLHSAPVAVSEYAIALPTLDGDPACALGSISSFGSKALWFEITDGLRQYRPMPSFFPPERSGDMRA